jgi:hypothetical protein
MISPDRSAAHQRGFEHYKKARYEEARVDVPDNKSTGEEIISSLGRHVDFRGGAVVIFTSNLEGEGRHPVNEPHGIVGEGNRIIRGVRRERLSTGRKLRHGEARAIRECLSAKPMLLGSEAHRDVSSHPVRLSSRSQLLDNPSSDQLRFALSAIKIFQRRSFVSDARRFLVSRAFKTPSSGTP